ncbi:hypothetical protein D6850_02995 [Roseovarius spongiae]|uniref:Putative Flp pilus-assembly TadG-like N-terminal domain-containing protein n=2 Tax=Roseovarius spongiae TaxID=2320272 RepID=A0A3A8AZ80_9RHOB|nr:hypothetical protein D6850_02995 [Roseovarius spongiae]
MLVAGGIAIDVSRQEMERAHIQNTLDAAVLAAAGEPYAIDGKAKAKAIVEDYFAKAGMSDYLNEINTEGEDSDIVSTVNSSKVTASAEMQLDTYLMHLSGVKTLKASGVSTAERRVPKLEVAMVLDVSGSMNSNNKLRNLKSSAKEFVTKILNSADPGDAVISVVPFSWNVTPGMEIFDELNVDVRHDYSSCIRFFQDDGDYDETGIDPETPRTQQIYTSRYGSFDNVNGESCYTNDYADILPFSISETALHNKIDSFQGRGNTSGHLGMKWGAGLLDPAFQPVKTALNGKTDEDGNKLVSDLVGAVPAQYNEAETLKVIVMMGDGENTTSYYFGRNSSYRGPNSDLYKVTYQEMEFQYAYKKKKKSKISYNESKCSNKKWACVYEATGETKSAHYLHDKNDDRYRDLKHNSWMDEDDFDDLPETMEGYIATERLSWEMAWGLISPSEYGNITGNWGPWNDYTGNNESRWWKDQRMDKICTAIKQKDVIVYTIGFEIPKNGHAEGELKDCASSVAHYYRAEGVNINDAFNSIASNVVNLRLTQ